MSSIKVVVVVCLSVALVIGMVIGAPLQSSKSQELTKNFIEFLQQDKELSAALHRLNLGEGGSEALGDRHRRQIEGDEQDEDGEQDVGTTGSKEPGFFDRAAKFVMEVLQRFLKWINSDN